MAYIDLQHQGNPLHLALGNFNVSIGAVGAASSFFALNCSSKRLFTEA